MSEELEKIWSSVQSELAATVGESTYRIWLEPLRAHDLSDGRLAIQAPGQACVWVRDRYGRILQTCVERVLGAGVQVEVLSTTGADRTSGDLRSGAPEVPSAARIPREERISSYRFPAGRSTEEQNVADRESRGGIGVLGNPKLTFDQFVIGDCNRLAHAAALTVAEMPAQAYNPLFICGPPGVGKTHLLSSIASLLLAHNPGLSVRATTGEAFTNEFLQALSGRRTDVFKTRHRHIDVLLVDDVQFLERKTRTEEEFFHTFNALYDGGRQIVLTSDRPPRDLRALEDRLRERFESGLLADIKPPDPATRMTILRKRAQHDRLTLADEEPLRLIAERVRDNVRAIEGALIRVVAYSSLTGKPLTSELTREVLDGLYPPTHPVARQGSPSVDEIAAAACRQFDVTPEELISSSRTARIAWARQVAMYLSRELTDESLPSIGRRFGGRDHTTVIHACRRTAARILDEDASREIVNRLRCDLGAEPLSSTALQIDRPD